MAEGVAGDQGLTTTTLTARIVWRRPWLATAAFLAFPAAWFVALYLAALAAMFVSAFWQVDSLSGAILPVFTLDNFREVFGTAVYRVIAARTIGIAAAVTLTDALLAFPFAWFLRRHAGPRLRGLLLALVMVPLWSSYLARVYAWRLILAHDGVLNWTLARIGLGHLSIAYSNWAMWIVFSYLWLPFMILPLYAALERIPDTLLEASEDLGARGGRTLRRVVLPLALPGLVAGSIFTFSLTLGDYVSPMLVGGPGSDFIGNVVYANVGVSNNIPFAAAYATVPLVVMALYLLAARAAGAFRAL